MTHKRRFTLDKLAARKLGKSAGLSTSGYMAARLAHDAGFLPEGWETPENLMAIAAAATWIVNAVRKFSQRFGG